MATSKNNDMYSYLDQLSTQEREDLLQKDMEAADGYGYVHHGGD